MTTEESNPDEILAELDTSLEEFLDEPILYWNNPKSIDPRIIPNDEISPYSVKTNQLVDIDQIKKQSNAMQQRISELGDLVGVFDNLKQILHGIDNLV